MPDATPPSGSTTSEPAIQILAPPGGPFAAIVLLRGEHDVATAPEVANAIGAIKGNLLVDLSDCAFIDSSVIETLITSAKTLERDGHFLEIVVPPTNAPVARTIEVVNLRALIPVHPERPSLG